MSARPDLSSLEKGTTSPTHSSTQIKILCLDLTHASRTVQLILCSGAVFIFYLAYGYMQELIFRLPGFRPFGWYLTLIQFSIYSVFGFLEASINSKSKARRIPLKTYVQLAFFTVATMGLSNASVGHLNYPTQVIFKCCKLIPVLIGGVFIQGKKIKLLDFMAALLMSVGLIFFSLTDNEVSPNFDTKGYIMISLALVADAVIGNVQEKAMKAHAAPNSEVVLYSYSIGCFYIFVGTLATGEFWEALNFCSQYPKETYGYAILFSLAGYLGINVVLTLVKSFGAFIAVTVTTCRKAVTIILSFLFFSKPFSPNYIWSGCIVLLGIYLNVYSKNREAWNQKLVVISQRAISMCQRWGVRRQSLSSQIV